MTIPDRIRALSRLEKEWMTVGQIAELLGERRDSVQGVMGSMIERGELYRRRIGAQVSYRTKESIRSRDILTVPWRKNSVFLADLCELEDNEVW